MEEQAGTVGVTRQQKVLRCGWLRKQGGFVKTWHSRWFVLRGEQLYYYKDEDESKALPLFPGREMSHVNAAESELPSWGRKSPAVCLTHDSLVCLICPRQFINKQTRGSLILSELSCTLRWGHSHNSAHTMEALPPTREPNVIREKHQRHNKYAVRASLELHLSLLLEEKIPFGVLG
ncbi:rho GTPase-activating protein 24 isoform X1 [Silurus meridionalis]|nr:rho GTPase-activating protein 24 isoform X1 [Silurus meridionalis]